MRDFFRCVKGFGGDNVILNARVEYKRFEDIEDFKKRVKKHKYYSEDYILEDLYTYMSFSDDLINLIEKQQKEIEREQQYNEFYKDFCDKQQKALDRLKKDKDILYGVIDELKGVNNE